MKNKIYSIVGIAALYAFFWWQFAHPYQLTPLQDEALFSSELRHAPFLKATISALKLVLPESVASTPSVLLAYSLFFNTLTLVALGLLLLSLNPSPIVCFLGVGLFAFSTWPTTYLFTATSAPLSGFLTVLSFLLLSVAFLKVEKTRLLLFVAGIVGGALSLVSEGMLPVLLIQVVAVYLLSASWKHSDRWKMFSAYGLPLLLIFGIGCWANGGALFVYIKDNLDASQLAESLANLGVFEQVPFGSFYFIGVYYAAPLLFAGTLAALLYSFIFLDMKRRRTTSEKVLFVLSALILSHPFLIDVLPYARTGTMHYPVYPLLIAVTILVAAHWFEHTDGKKLYFNIVASVLVLYTLTMNLMHTSELVRVKQGAAEFVKNLENTETEIYVLEDDIHASAMEKWLSRPLTRISDPSEIYAPEGRRAALLIGPRGSGSGKSIHMNPTLRDFSVRLKKPTSAKSHIFPYFGFFPPIVFEAEGAAGFYFAGVGPSHTEENLHLTFWVWGS